MAIGTICPKHPLGSSGLRPQCFKKKEWWRRGESGYFIPLITRNLQRTLDAKNAKSCQIAPNWNVTGTRLSPLAGQDFGEEAMPAPQSLHHAAPPSWGERIRGWQILNFAAGGVNALIGKPNSVQDLLKTRIVSQTLPARV